jgi:hypothetical protein
MIRAQVSIIAIAAVLIVLVALGIFATIRFASPSSASGFEDVELALGECIVSELDTLIPLAAKHGGELAYSIDMEGDVARSVRDDRGSLVPLWTRYQRTSDPLVYTRPKLHDDDLFGGGIEYTIEEQFEIMLDSRLASCLERSSERLGVQASADTVTSEVTIGDDVRVSALVIGTFTRDDRTTTRLLAERRVETSFSDLFEAAQALSAIDAQTGLFASYIQDVITLGSGVEERYPPMYDLDFGYATKMWTADAVALELSRDLDDTLGLIAFSTSDNPLNPPYLIRRGVIDLERSGRPIGDDVFVSVARAAPPDVSFDGDRLTSGDPFVSMLPIIGDMIPIREYRTAYDVSVPLIVTLTSRDDGLRFRFAIEPRIDSNEVLRSSSTSISFPHSDASLARRAFCDDPTGSSLALSLSGADPDETSLIYTCGSITCTYPYASSVTLPACIGGTLSAQAPHAKFAPIAVDSSMPSSSATLVARRGASVRIEGALIETEPVKRSGRPHALNPIGSRVIDDSEQLVVSFTGIDVDHSAAVVITDTPRDVLLYEGVYSVSVTALRSLDQAVIIPERSDCIAWCILGRLEVDEVLFEDTLILGQHTDLGPAFITSDSDSVRIEVPIFDLSSIDESERVVEDLEFYDVLDRSLSGSEVFVS